MRMANIAILMVPPTISEKKDRDIQVNSETGSLFFIVADPDDRIRVLKVTADSSNTEIVRANGMKISGKGERHSVRVVTEKGQTTGSTRNALTVTDPDGLSDTTSFVLKVRRTS